MRKKYELKKVLEELARSRDIELTRLTPQELINRGMQLDNHFEFDVYSCISFADSFHKDGFVLLGKRDKPQLSILYLGHQWGEYETYGVGNNLKSRMVYHPSEVAIVESQEKRADLSGCTTIRIRDKTLEQALKNARDYKNYDPKVESFKTRLETKPKDLDFLRRFLAEIF